jgi:hypothetical protein
LQFTECENIDGQLLKSARTSTIILAPNLGCELVLIRRMQNDIFSSTQELFSYWTGILTVGCTAAAAVFGSLSRSFYSRVSALKEEMRIRPTNQSTSIWIETIPSLKRAADSTGKAAVWLTAAAAACGCLYWWFSSNVTEVKEEARIRFERESAMKIEAAEQGTAHALAEAANARKDTAKLEVEAARLHEQAALAESKIKAAEVRAAEANERSAMASEGTAKALAEASSAKENTTRLEIESANLRERAARAEKELIEVQDRIKPRRITDAQRARLIQALKPVPKGPIGITTTIGDGEARILAGQIQALLKASGWEDVHISQALFKKPMIGVMIELHDLGNIPLFAVPLLNAFHSNDISKTLAYNSEVPEG